MKRILLSLLFLFGIQTLIQAGNTETYSNEEAHFSFKYPNYWTIADKLDPNYDEEADIEPPTIIIEKIASDVNNKGKLQKYVSTYFLGEKKNNFKQGYKAGKIVWKELASEQFATTTETYMRLTDKYKEQKYFVSKDCGEGCNGLIFTLRAPEKMFADMAKEIEKWEKSIKLK